MTMSPFLNLSLLLANFLTAHPRRSLADPAGNATEGVGTDVDDVWTKERMVREFHKLTTYFDAKVDELLTKRLDSANWKHGASSSVYVRWGSKSCPATSQTEYSGVVGGGIYSQDGAGVNALCMTSSPVYDGKSKTKYSALLFGAEYKTQPEPIHDMDVVCAVCMSPRVAVMIPGTNTCHPGWIKEYSGYLMAGYGELKSGTEFLCMDAATETDHKSSASFDSGMFYYVVGQCGSLPCPPYQQDRVITCVVCSK